MHLKNILSLAKFIANVIILTGILSLNHSFSQDENSVKIDGGALFKSKCASCHQPHKNGTGPKLYNARSKWAEGGAKENSIYLWVNNWQQAAAVDPYAMGVSQVMPTAMNAFPELSKNQIDAILDWVDEQPDPALASAGGNANVGVAGDDTSEEDSNAMIWMLFGVAFIVIILSL